MTDCELLEKCVFFKKYNGYKGAMQYFIDEYCKDVSKSEKCERKIIRMNTGTPPPEDLMPNGKMVDDIY